MAPESVDTADKLLEAPSRRKHNYTMQDLAGCIRDLQNTLGPLSNPKHVKEVQARLAALQHQYDEKKRFFDEGKHILGRPWMSSGFKRRTIDNGRLDWALINFEDNRRIGSNQIPPASQWPDPDRAPLESGNILNGIAPIKDPQARTTVFKVGARTGPTRGKYSHIKPDVRMPDDDRLGMPDSSEHSFVYSGSQEQLFGIRGDSGAFVFTLDGKLIGVLFGGPVSETLKPGLVTYVTGAEELLKDIQAQFKGIYKIELSPD